MLKPKTGFERLFFTICLTVNMFILLGSLTSAGSVEYATYYPRAHNVVNGTYVSGSLPSSLQNTDSDYFTVASSPSSTSTQSYNPSGYNLPGATYVSGNAEDLVSNNDVYQVYRSLSSASSAQSLYAHQETTTIGGNSYFYQRSQSPDFGTNLTALMYPTGRNLLGRFIYPLDGISSIPASTWTEFYRAWRDPDQSISYDSTGSGNNDGGSTSVTWSHDVGSGSNRFMVIGVAIATVTVSVTSVTVGSRSATWLRNDTRGTVARGELWYLVNPNSGSQTVTVALSGTSKATGGSVSYTGVDQISPIENHAANVSYAGFNPSVSLTTTTTSSWIFSNLAISGTYTVTVHPPGQIHRYYEIGSGGNRVGDDGDDRVAAAPGFYTMSWTMSFSAEVVAQALAFKPAPVPAGHVDVDISILKSDGTIRTSIASGVANSMDLTPTPTTLSGTYYWSGYSVVDQTDFLEIDYYVDVASGTSGVSAYLRVDDVALPTDDQTRTIDIMLPIEQTVDVELTGTCNAYNWTQFQWAMDSAWTADSVAVTMQVYDYTLGAYSTSGNGFLSYTSNTTANTDEGKTQVISVNPQNFRDAAGNWKVQVKGVKAVGTPFDFKADWLELKPTYYSEYTVSTEFQFSSMTGAAPVELNFSLVSEYDIPGASVTVQVWNYSSSEYATDGQGYLTYTSLGSNETQRLSINVNPEFYVSSGDAKIRISALLSTGTQYHQKTNQASLIFGVAGVIQPFDWNLLLYVLPVPFAFFFVAFMVFRRKKKTSFEDKKTDLFSGQFGMNHQEMTGKKMLLEIDPTSDYILAFSGFVSEAKNSGASLLIITNEGSALHSVFSKDARVNFLLLSSKTQSMQQMNERVTLVPTSDLSGILAIFNGIRRAAGEGSMCLLFDNISDVVANRGLDETYEFLRSLLDAISSPSTTAVFAFIPDEHGQEVLSSVRGLFQDRFAYSNDGARTGNL